MTRTHKGRLVASSFAMTLLLVALFVMISSVAFIVLEADHECAGEHCPGCCRLDACKEALGHLFTGTVMNGSSAELVQASPLCRNPREVVDRAWTTLVTLKVKLSN